jgi:hypothetical protein
MTACAIIEIIICVMWNGARADHIGGYINMNTTIEKRSCSHNVRPIQQSKYRRRATFNISHYLLILFTCTDLAHSASPPTFPSWRRQNDYDISGIYNVSMMSTACSNHVAKMRKNGHVLINNSGMRLAQLYARTGVHLQIFNDVVNGTRSDITKYG